MAKIRSVSDIKFFLYISSAKLDTLFAQIASSGKEKTSVEWNLDLKALKLGRKTEREEEPDRLDKLKAVTEALEYNQVVGTVDEPKDYVKGTLPMRWGIYKDAGRPEGEPPLVYFGGRTEQTIFGFGGSTRHVEGNAGIAATGSRSMTPYLVAHLLDGMPRDGWNAFHHRSKQDGDGPIFDAITLATDNIRPPDFNLEFFSKTLLLGEHFDSRKTSCVMRVLLGSPLYVALASPYPPELSDF